MVIGYSSCSAKSLLQVATYQQFRAQILFSELVPLIMSIDLVDAVI